MAERLVGLTVVSTDCREAAVWAAAKGAILAGLKAAMMVAWLV